MIERASATPAAQSPQPTALTPGAAPVGLRLADFQRWFQTIITNPDGLGPGVAAARAAVGRDDATMAAVVTRGHLDPAVRMEVYRNAYHLRLIECLADDFPAVQELLGKDRFARIARSYIAAFPSRQPNLNRYSIRFPDFLAAESRQAFAADLARLEWAMIEAIHAAPAEPFDLTELQALAPDHWADLRLRPAPASRLLELAHPANAWFQAWRVGQPLPPARKGRSFVLVYRAGERLWRMDLTPLTADLLRRLFAGETLGAAISALGDVPDLAPRVIRWFREWVAGGVFSR